MSVAWDIQYERKIIPTIIFHLLNFLFVSLEKKNSLLVSVGNDICNVLLK